MGGFAACETVGVESRRIPRQPEVNDRMTSNWPSVVVYLLLLAFFAVVAIGIGLGAYAASVLKRREGELAEP